MTSSSIKILAKSLLILYLQELGFLAPRAGFSRTLTPRVGLFLAVVESEYIPSKWISSFRLRPSSHVALIVISFMKCQQL